MEMFLSGQLILSLIRSQSLKDYIVSSLKHDIDSIWTQYQVRTMYSH